MSIVEMMYNPRFTGVHSSPKERQLLKCFGKSVTSTLPISIMHGFINYQYQLCMAGFTIRGELSNALIGIDPLLS